MIRPPSAPVPRIGAAALVMIASGRLSKIPMNNPTAQPGQGRRIFGTTNPIANRAMNAPSMAARLSKHGRPLVGEGHGIISATSMPANASPHRMPNEILDIAYPPASGSAEASPRKKFPVNQDAAAVKTPLQNARRSALIWSAFVVGIPCGKPL
jgi:hypothetical protein